jgi:hypothetical protein
MRLGIAVLPVLYQHDFLFFGSSSLVESASSSIASALALLPLPYL